MVSQEERTEPKLKGSAKQKGLASRVFALARARGSFMSTNTPILVSVAAIAEFFTDQGEEVSANQIESAVKANSGVFSLSTVDGQSMIATTRAGTAPVEIDSANPHTFADRFMTPLPKPERPPQPVRERARVAPSWATLPAVLSDMELEDDELGDEEEVVAEEGEFATSTVTIDDAAVDPDVVEVEALVPDEVAPPPARTITLPVVAPTDVTGVDDLALATAIRERLLVDPRVANFGEQWLMEDRVPRFSRGDLRRMKDYLQEQEQPLTDEVLVQDVLGLRPGTPEFELTRFAINYRLSREHRDFEFVGTANQRFWSTGSLPQIGTTRRKPNEIGTDYRYLLDETPGEPAHRSSASVDTVLTHYEYIHGLLPYSPEMQTLLPAPLLPNQRSAVLTFECPQSYTTYLVELRYPTPNRGGFILGLDDFYTENLVPGAIISIAKTENDGHYRVEYLAEQPENARLLELDDRRAQRYVFRPTTYACGVEEAMLLTEERFGSISGEKPLDEKARRRPESVIATTFGRAGENHEGNYSAEFPTLLSGVNIERPVSATLLRSILENDDTGAFSRDPERNDVYTYVPGHTS
jgi:hypothetical protein